MIVSCDNDFDKAKAKTRAEQMLDLLRCRAMTTSELVTCHGHRFSASICDLRKQGYVIVQGRTETNEPLWILNGKQERVEVTDEMKAAYYASEHWRTLRAARRKFDGERCVMCHASPGLFGLEVHHWRYDLFAEKMHDLMTLCETCHRETHENPHVQIHFPHYVTPEIAEKLRQATP